MLPKAPVVLFTMAPLASVAAVGPMYAAGVSPGPLMVVMLAGAVSFLVGMAWIGRTVRREPSPDARGTFTPL